MGDHRLEYSRAIEYRNIREALGNPIGCDIREHNNVYIIKPEDKQKMLQINALHDTVDDGIFYLLRTYNLVFDHCIFVCEIEVKGTAEETIIPNVLMGTPIYNKIRFKDCIFQKPVYFFYVILIKDIVFQNTTFENIALFGAIFKLRTEFLNCRFQSEADFSSSIFSKKADFTRTIFKASAYFDKTTFESSVTFERSEFCENAHFYQTKFNEDPKFFQTTFNEHLNLTDTKIHNEDPNVVDAPIFNFDFEGLKEKAQTCSEADKYRDVFKNIKNALIKSGNLLGASRFRKMELYCKEIELDLKKKENRETSTRDFVDRIQLYCYRVTSDHHTDLMLILNNVIFLIALFGVMNLGLGFYTKNITTNDAITKIYRIETWETFTATIIFVAIVLGFMLDCHRIFKEIMRLVFSSELCMLMILASLFLIPLLSFTPVLYIAFLTYPPNLLWVVISLICIYCSIRFRCFVCVKFLELYTFNFKKLVFIPFYFIVVFMLIFKPSLLIPILGKLIENKNYGSYHCDNFDIFGFCCTTESVALETLNLIYMFLLFLLLFSLQKTARKNTIVPN